LRFIAQSGSRANKSFSSLEQENMKLIVLNISIHLTYGYFDYTFGVNHTRREAFQSGIKAAM